MGQSLSDEEIKQLFPLLYSDTKFRRSSPEDSRYNCISWAMQKKDRWTAVPAGYRYLDGVVWWPPGAQQGMDISCLVDAFEHEGYELCDDDGFDNEWLKVALYYKPETNEWTHAARQLRNGVWASKLGQSNDIEHGTPYTLEGDVYGKVYCIMKTRFYSSRTR